MGPVEGRQYVPRSSDNTPGLFDLTLPSAYQCRRHPLRLMHCLLHHNLHTSLLQLQLTSTFTGAVLQHHLPVHADYNGLPIDTDCSSTQQQQEPYAHQGSIDYRRDNPLSHHHIPSSYPFATPHSSNGSTRYVSDRSSGDSHRYVSIPSAVLV